MAKKKKNHVFCDFLKNSDFWSKFNITNVFLVKFISENVYFYDLWIRYKVISNTKLDISVVPLKQSGGDMYGVNKYTFCANTVNLCQHS